MPQSFRSDLQVGARRQYDCTLDHVLEFAYVARPRVGDKTFHRRLWNVRDPASQSSAFSNPPGRPNRYGSWSFPRFGTLALRKRVRSTLPDAPTVLGRLPTHI